MGKLVDMGDGPDERTASGWCRIFTTLPERPQPTSSTQIVPKTVQYSHTGTHGLKYACAKIIHAIHTMEHNTPITNYNIPSSLQK